jgi:hypothetical protein
MRVTRFGEAVREAIVYNAASRHDRNLDPAGGSVKFPVHFHLHIKASVLLTFRASSLLSHYNLSSILKKTPIVLCL